uniref:Reverse transcriptase n=1 Tax=Cannabis sativa TaxID=3483 RepID=A0A803NWW7_CANSA
MSAPSYKITSKGAFKPGKYNENIELALLLGQWNGEHLGEGEKNEGIEELGQNFLQLMSLDLEPDFEINAEITRTGVLASFFEGKGVSRTQEDYVSILENRPWLINGKLLIIQEWPEQGDWSNADMSKAIFWVRATGLPTPYLNAMNTPRIAAKAGEYKGYVIMDQRTLARRGFLKFQVELSTQHQLSPGFFLDILRGRKEWIQFQYFRLPKFCYNCGFIGHDKNTCVRETSFAYPPEGAAVPAYGPWISAESAVISCFNTRNQLNFFRERRSVGGPSEAPQLPPFSPGPVDTPFKVGSGASSSSATRGGTKRRRGAGSKTSSRSRKQQNTARNEEGSTAINLEETLNLIEVNVTNRQTNYNGLGEKTLAGVCFLMETKVDRGKMEVWQGGLGFNGMSIIPSKSLAGGFCLLWNNEVKIQMKELHYNIFEASIQDPQLNSQWRLFAVYGPPYDREKKEFWEYLNFRIKNGGELWLVMGDLNCIMNQEEKMGGSKVFINDTRWLEEFLLASGGVDLRFKGGQFTWQNKRFNGGLIWERLDRCIGSFDWTSEFPQAGVLNFPITISDHAPISLDTAMFKNKGYIPFRFYEACIRKALQRWKKEKVGDLDQLICSLERRLQWIQQQQITADLSLEEYQLQAKLEDTWRMKESIWRQNSREYWLKLGDRSTTFFHAAASICRRRNQVWSLQDKDGVMKENINEVSGIITDYFKNLFTSDQPDISMELEDLFDRKIGEEENQSLTRIPSIEEIRDTVFSIHPLKSPGPDGLPGRFFRKYWDVVGSNVYKAVQEVFATGEVHPKLNYTFICLIPKVNNPRRMEQFRPISLCNFPYKIITKILVNRMRPYMEDLISPFQSAFIPGRWIAESSILTQELVQTIRRKRGMGGLMAIKLDMHNAYDRMEWTFIRKVLRANGFDEKSCGLIMSCVTGVTYSAILNGTPLKKFQPQRGLRQGDPLSPFIFLQCQEVLSKIIQKHERENKIHGIQIARAAIPISHLMFADDTILFARANKEEAKNLMDCISKYEKWSGQVCSKAKSSVLFSNNLSVERRNGILHVLNINQTQGEERHLGNPFVFKRRKKENYMNLREIKKKSTDSSLWKCILDTRNIILKGSLALPVGGETIDIWNQPWIPWLEFEEFKNLMDSFRPRRYTARTLADLSTGHAWNKEVVLQFFGKDLGDRILKIPRLPYPNKDKIIWKQKQNGQFSVKSAYIVDQKHKFKEVQEIWKWLWHSDLHPRILILLWCVLNNAIPVKERLPFLMDKECPLCNVNLESCLHLFRDCSFVKILWFSGVIPLRIEKNRGDTIQSFVQNLVRSLSDVGIGRKEILTYLGCIIKHLWIYRNRLCREGKKDQVQQVQSRIRNSYDCYLNFKATILMRHRGILPLQREGSRGNSQEVPWIICTDASWYKGEAGLLAVMINKDTDQWATKTAYSKASSGLDAELSAILMALSWAIQEGKKEVHLLSDCKVAVQALANRKCPPDWKILNKSLSVLDYCSKFKVCEFYFISRSLNQFADDLAKSARVSKQLEILFQGEGDPPVIPTYLPD